MHFTTFPGWGKCPPCPCLRAPMPTPFSLAVWVRPCQLCYFVGTPLAVFPQAVINWIEIWRIWRPRLDKFRSFFLWQLNDSTCAEHFKFHKVAFLMQSIVYLLGTCSYSNVNRAVPSTQVTRVGLARAEKKLELYFLSSTTLKCKQKRKIYANLCAHWSLSFHPWCEFLQITTLLDNDFWSIYLFLELFWFISNRCYTTSLIKELGIRLFWNILYS